LAFLSLDTNARARRPSLEVVRAPRPEPRVLTPATAARLVALALALRLISALVGFLANVTFPAYADQRFTVFDRPHAFWDTFARYDAGWYFGIASNGYAYVEGGRSNLAFFPLYPLLMRLGGQLMGGEQPHFYLAGIAVSWAAFVGSMLLLYRLARLELSHEAALRATAYAAVFPSAYFFGRIYSESLFFLALVGTVLALRLGRWPLALVLGASMTATRVNGITLVPALLLIGWEASRGSPRARIAALVAAAGASAGLVAYCVFNYALSGDPLAWYYSIERWGYRPLGNPLSGLAAVWHALLTRPYQFLAAEEMAPYDAFNTVLATVSLAAVPFVWRRFGRVGAAYALVILLGLGLPLSSGQLEGLGRYCAVLFPVPLLLASLEGSTRHLALLASSAMLYTLGLALFVNVYPLF
jgi:hypothetical protein